MLHAFIATNRDLIISRTREKVSRRGSPAPTESELAHGVPLFLDQLAVSLRSHGRAGAPEIEASAALRGAELLEGGLTIGQVVQDYGNICQAITELAVELRAEITSDDFRVLNECLDLAIAKAVSEYAHRREHAVVGVGAERLGFLAHELRNLLSTATLAFDAVRSGSVGVGGSTGALVTKCHDRMSDLVTRSLAEIRLDNMTLLLESVRLGVVLEEIAIGTVLHARARSVTLAIFPVATDLTVHADFQIVASIVTNLVQNACKFTRERGRVSVQTRVTTDRVFVDVADECGGLGPDDTEDLFAPYAQRGTDRTGVGLGLAISRKGARALGGDIQIKNLPGVGCVFTLELRRSATP